MATLRQRYAVIALMVPAVLLSGAAPALSATKSAQNLLEGEALNLPSGQGAPVSDPGASGSRALLIWSNATATGSVAGVATDTIVVTARGDQCAGAPQMSVTIDGRIVLS